MYLFIFLNVHHNFPEPKVDIVIWLLLCNKQSKTFNLLLLMTKKSRKSKYLKSWNQHMSDFSAWKNYKNA